jgi:hypothetical protein
VSKVGLLIDGSHFLGVGGGRDVRGELRDQNGPAPCHRTGQFGELAQTLWFLFIFNAHTIPEFVNHEQQPTEKIKRKPKNYKRNWELNLDIYDIYGSLMIGCDIDFNLFDVGYTAINRISMLGSCITRCNT